MKALQVFLFALLLVTSCAAQGSETPLQQRADAAQGKDCAHLSMQASHQALEDADRQFIAGDVKTGHANIDVSLHYATRSVDCSLQAHRTEKSIEIDLRKLTRRMKDVMQTLDSEDRPHLKQTLVELENQRDRLLRGMFGAAAANDSEKQP
jgi:hypothetical protein